MVSNKNPEPNQEPFRIIWTRLAFEVRLSAYDKLLNHAYSSLRSLSGGGGGGRARNALQKQLEAGISPLANLSAAGANGTQCQAPLDATKSKRTIFENLNGYVNSGELTAILGPSGSGKTSLLNAICGRTENYRGQMRLIGASKQRRMRLSIIPQKDYLIENLTVRENLLYSSQILNPEAHFDHEANIERVVQMLNLRSCYHSAAANISGGEYKRVSIAQELLKQPDILVLDEPTSGLDSLNCKRLIRSLVQLVDASRRGGQQGGFLRPIAIVMTIHQPDVEVFHMFDHIYCMARGGRVIFDGRPGDALAHVQAHADIPRTSELTELVSGRDGEANRNPTNDRGHEAHRPVNPANLLIEIASEDLYGREPVDKLARVQRKQFETQMQQQVQSLGEATGGASSQESLLTASCKTTATDSAATFCTSASDVDLSQLQVNLLAATGGGGGGGGGGAQPDDLAVAPATDTLDRAKSVNPLTKATTIATISHSAPTAPAAARASSQASSSSTLASSANGTCGASRSRLVRDKRLTPKNDHHAGRFWYYTRVLAQRAFKSTLRDPLMTLITMLFHLAIPFVMWTVYPRRIGSVHGCPVIQRELDIVSMASNRTADRLEDLHEQMTITLECSTMFFLTTYSFSMCSLTVSALAFPLNMHVLLKEVRNGWYNLPSYVLAKTLANFPFEVLFPVLSLVMMYELLDMPSAPYEWRLALMALVMALVSMISHTQGLIFGALCMDSVQTAIFMASASTLPQALLSGFTARIRFMPLLLQRLSWLSQYRYSSDLINIVRFGFGICPCSPATDEFLRTTPPEFKDMPANLKPVFIYYLMNNTPNPSEQLANAATATANSSSSLDPLQGSHLGANGTLLIAAQTNSTALEAVASVVREANASALVVAPPGIPGVDSGVMLSAAERYSLLTRMDAGEVDLFANMAEMISRAFSFGRRLDGCPSVRSQILNTAGTPTDDLLPLMLAGLFCLLLAFKLVLFLTVRQKIGARL